MAYRTPLARAQGLGSAKTGTSHWWLQRVTAAALIPLTPVFLDFMSLVFKADHDQIAIWFRPLVHSVCLLLWILCAFYHTALGLQVVIEDYVGPEGRKIIGVWLVKLSFLLLGLAAAISVVRITLAGS